MVEFRRGDTWKGVPMIKILVNGQPPIFPAASARLQFRSSQGVLGCPELTTENGGIIIEDAGLWWFSLPKSNLEIMDGRWLYDLETIDTQGDIQTFVEGAQPIKEDITR